MGNIDPKFSGEIFRQDHPIILACDRHLAKLHPVRMRYLEGGYAAGLVIARNTGDGLYDAYDSGGSSGLDTAAGILQDKVECAVSGVSEIAVGIFGGEVYESKLTGLDSDGKTDLNGRSFTGADGVAIFSF